MVYQEDNAEGNIPRVCTGGGKAKLFPRAVDEDKPMTVLNSIFFIDFSKKNKINKLLAAEDEDEVVKNLLDKGAKLNTASRRIHRRVRCRRG